MSEEIDQYHRRPMGGGPLKRRLSAERASYL